MNKILVLMLAAILVTCGCNRKKGAFPQGAWTMVQILVEENGKTYVSFPTATATGSQHKVWTDSKWMWTATYEDETGSMEGFGGGSYTLDGKQYVEHVEFITAEAYENQTLEMEMEFVDDTLIQSYNPFNEQGQLVDDMLVIEKYIRWE